MKIFDIIHYKTKIQDTFFVIIEERNTPVYEEVEPNLFQSSTDDIYDALDYRRGTRDAFAGREFKILMTDGTEKTIKGDHWSVIPVCEEKLINIGYATLEELQHCYVFAGGYVRKSVIDEWLSKNKPKEDYYFYK